MFDPGENIMKSEYSLKRAESQNPSFARNNTAPFQIMETDVEFDPATGLPLSASQ
jgi:hypothetical protein